MYALNRDNLVNTGILSNGDMVWWEDGAEAPEEATEVHSMLQEDVTQLGLIQYNPTPSVACAECQMIANHVSAEKGPGCSSCAGMIFVHLRVCDQFQKVIEENEELRKKHAFFERATQCHLEIKKKRAKKQDWIDRRNEGFANAVSAFVIPMKINPNHRDIGYYWNNKLPYTTSYQNLLQLILDMKFEYGNNADPIIHYIISDNYLEDSGYVMKKKEEKEKH